MCLRIPSDARNREIFERLDHTPVTKTWEDKVKVFDELENHPNNHVRRCYWITIQDLSTYLVSVNELKVNVFHLYLWHKDLMKNDNFVYHILINT